MPRTSIIIRTTPSPHSPTSLSPIAPEGSPMQYRVELEERRRRTVFVTSDVPPSQWETQNIGHIIKLADIAEGEPIDASDLPVQRSQSLEERHAITLGDSTRSRSAQDLHCPAQSSRYQSRRTSLKPGDALRMSSANTPPNSPLSPARRRILFYHKHDPYYGFTNFSPHPVYYNGRRYPTSEHLFQSFKFQGHRPNLAEHIRTCSERPSVAFAEARRFQPEVRADWKKVNIQKMEETIYHKFTQHQALMQELLSTGDAELVEDSDKDPFWGVGADGRGRNELGKALERLRAQFRGL